MGVFEGSPKKNKSPFVAFSRVKPKYKDPSEVALRKYPKRFFRSAEMTSGGGAYKAATFKFGAGHRPAAFTSKDEEFVPAGTHPFPGDFPEDIRPYSGPGWDFIEPYGSAEGIGQDAPAKKESGWDKLVSTVTAAVPQATEAWKKYKKGSKTKKLTQDAPAPAPVYIPPPPPDNTLLYTGMAVGGVLVVGLTAYLLLRR
jgi:hypothetical protein